MRYEHEKHRKIVAIEARIARQARRSDIVLGLVATLGVLALAVLMAFSQASWSCRTPAEGFIHSRTIGNPQLKPKCGLLARG